MPDFSVHTRIHAETLIPKLQSILDRKLKKGLSDETKMYSAELLRDASRKYVPSSGKDVLRDSAKIVPYKETYAVEYNPQDKYGRFYGKAQYEGKNGTNTVWKRHTEFTYSHWNRHISRAEMQEIYANVAKRIIEGMNNG